MNYSYLKTRVLDIFYFVLVFIIATTIASLALVRRINSYESTRKLILNVHKEAVVVANTLPGTVDKIIVHEGQHVKKGDILVDLVDDAANTKLNTLEKVAKDNISASTEAMLLQSQAPQYEIKASRDGIIYKVNVVEGTYLSNNTPIITMFADGNVKLTSLVDDAQFNDIQKTKTFEVYNSRLQQTYNVILEGIGQVFYSPGNQTTKYELQFNFIDPDEGTSFVEGENLEIIAKSEQTENVRPNDYLRKFWNSFIIGK